MHVLVQESVHDKAVKCTKLLNRSVLLIINIAPVLFYWAYLSVANIIRNRLYVVGCEKRARTHVESGLQSKVDGG